MMKKVIYFLMLVCSFSLSAQESPIAEQDVQKIIKHMQSRYTIPDQVLRDSIDRINYKIRFTIDVEGKVTQPKIISKNIECLSCERELFRVIKTAPAIAPAYRDGKKVEAYFEVPFYLILQ